MGIILLPAISPTGTAVSEFYKILQYRQDIQVSSDALLPIVNIAVRIIAKKLYVLGSSIIVANMGLPIVLNDAYAALPADFWGLVDRPFLNGYQNQLLPLPSLSVELQYQHVGLPKYYRILGTRMQLIPASGGSYTVVADYFQKPTSITALTDKIPFNELFDDIISEYVLRWFRGKQTAVEAQILQKMVEDDVSIIAIKYDKKSPVQASGIDWNFGILPW